MRRWNGRIGNVVDRGVALKPGIYASEISTMSGCPMYEKYADIAIDEAGKTPEIRWMSFAGSLRE